ncbi:MAG: hypothetical protein M0D54_10470 [Hyphomonadaceae bacterium JAD_PAG50586_4]|nr:MAG: hypothetical protein M0D54_10470 [Hyphomonadaceae bacterium JAD_PAG50586_4]
MARTKQQKQQKLEAYLLEALKEDDLGDLREKPGAYGALADEIRRTVERDPLAKHFLATIFMALVYSVRGERLQWQSIAEAINAGPHYFGEIIDTDISAFARRESLLPGKPHRGPWRDALAAMVRFLAILLRAEQPVEGEPGELARRPAIKEALDYVNPIRIYEESVRFVRIGSREDAEDEGVKKFLGVPWWHSHVAKTTLRSLTDFFSMSQGELRSVVSRLPPAFALKPEDSARHVGLSFRRIGGSNDLMVSQILMPELLDRYPAGFYNAVTSDLPHGDSERVARGFVMAGPKNICFAGRPFVDDGVTLVAFNREDPCRGGTLWPGVFLTADITNQGRLTCTRIAFLWLKPEERGLLEAQRLGAVAEDALVLPEEEKSMILHILDAGNEIMPGPDLHYETSPVTKPEVLVHALRRALQGSGFTMPEPDGSSVNPVATAGAIRWGAS